MVKYTGKTKPKRSSSYNNKESTTITAEKNEPSKLLVKSRGKLTPKNVSVNGNDTGIFCVCIHTVNWTYILYRI